MCALLTFEKFKSVTNKTIEIILTISYRSCNKMFVKCVSEVQDCRLKVLKLVLEHYDNQQLD